jgi:hypothetical protein
MYSAAKIIEIPNLSRILVPAFVVLVRLLYSK